MRIRYELDSVQNILHNQYAQYKQARDAIEMINYKYHDLKHHIIVLRAEENTEKRNEYLNQMEADLLNYEAQNKTGNTVIDVVLTMKTIYCQKHGITITSVIDGTLFKFMNTMDVSASDHWFHLKILIPIPDSSTATDSNNNKKNSRSSF